MLLALGVATIASPGHAAQAILRYDSIHHPVIADAGMVVSQNDIASRTGRDILARGGNAVDAAVATGFALAVTLPRAGNIGGSGFMLVHQAETGQNHALDYRSTAPAAFDLAPFKRPDGSIDYEALTFGPAAAAVPGTVAGLHSAWQQYGSLPWESLLAPAITLARDGIEVSDDLAFALAAAKDVFARYPASRGIFLKPDGTTYRRGEILRQPDLAETLALIARDGPAAFYTGALAQRLVSNLQADGGSISMADLAAYQVRPRTPIATRYRGLQVISMPPASGGGLALLQMLNILGHFDLAALHQGSAASLHLIAETMKLGAANRRVGIGDPDFVDVPVAGYLSPELARELADGIDLSRARPVADIQPVDAQPYESRETTHFTVVDRQGNAVTNTYTLGYSFGSGYVVPGTGILLDNQIRNFSLRDPSHANSMVAGKRMASSMTPTLVLDEAGDLMLATGTPGGSRIINVILQLLVNVIDYQMNIAEATAAPRIHQPWRGGELALEPGISTDTRDRLAAMGHQVRDQQTMGSTQSIRVRDGLYYGAADPRRPGALAIGLNKPLDVRVPVQGAEKQQGIR